MLQFRGLLPVTAVLLAVAAAPAFGFEARTLDGSGNNRAHPSWGRADTAYPRAAPARYADGISTPVPGPAPRFISNRIFNDLGQNLFSERGVSQWVWTWGQFLDHTFGLAQAGSEKMTIPFDAADPLETFRNDFGVIPFTRDAAAPGTGTSPANPRQSLNTVSSFIDAWNVYGGTRKRLAWLRHGPRLLLEHGWLPRAKVRGNARSAPAMAVDGMLRAHPQDAVVAGDVRANENIALTAVQTLFAREHNRIVDALPRSLPAEQKFQIARRVVGAEEQYITYTEFLPAVGVRLPLYRGYEANVNPSLTTEFATVGYRMHSTVHGEFEIERRIGYYSTRRLRRLQRMGVQIELAPDGREVHVVVPLALAFFNPDLLPAVGEGPLLRGLAAEPEYKNDEQFDNALRSTLFRVPGGMQGVGDLAAMDIQRARDHGIASYNQLRQAYGLPPKPTFAAITGEPEGADTPLDVNDPTMLDFVELRDAHGAVLAPGTQTGAAFGLRRTSLAARLHAIYGTVDDVDAFVGMVSEPHVPGTEMGELQLAMWTRQFAALRDGDRFFYARDPALRWIRKRFGITYRHTLAQLIALNTDEPLRNLPANVFFAG